ncbi:hypothetical protein SLA2020_405260 [Shorea laevis]
MKRSRRKNVGGVDRISDLPESIIHQIMSFLPAKEVARTSVLSKKWYHFKASYPVLELKGPFGDMNKFRQVVYDSLRHFSQNKLRLVAFCIEFFSDSLYSDLYSWIGLALENGVKRLDLCRECNSRCKFDSLPKHLFTLPRPLFSSNTLTVLNLTRCYLDQPLSIFNSFRELSFNYCFIKDPIIWKDDDFPFLECLVLCQCPNLTSVQISNLRRLHTIDVDFGSSFSQLVVASPSIQSFTISLLPSRHRWSEIINIDGCDHLKSLFLKTADTITDRELHSLLSKLTLLEVLFLSICCQLNKIKISSPCLKTLQISDMKICRLSIIEIATPNLKNFIYMGARKKPCRIKVAECCCNLETLVLYGYFATERTFHNLISKFPLLENLWMVKCDKLGRLKLLNPQLKRLHVAKCCNLKAVTVDGPNLIELCYIGLDAPKITVPDFVKASGGLRFEHEPSTYSSSRLGELLALKSEHLTSWVIGHVPGWRGC